MINTNDRKRMHICPNCNNLIYLEIMRDKSGYYIGTKCHCGQHTVNSSHYLSYAEAETAFEINDFFYHNEKNEKGSINESN